MSATRTSPNAPSVFLMAASSKKLRKPTLLLDSRALAQAAQERGRNDIALAGSPHWPTDVGQSARDHDCRGLCLWARDRLRGRHVERLTYLPDEPHLFPGR